MSWKNDDELIEIINVKLNSCLIGDVLDAMGKKNQFLPPRIRPLDNSMRVAGRAMPVLEADCSGTRIGYKDEEKAFGIMFEALDSLKKNDIYICTGSSPEYAQWGGLMSRRAINLKANGAVMNGFSRDTIEIKELGFSVFSFGPYGQDQGIRGRVVDYSCPIRFPNGVDVEPGALVIGDIDGVVTIPRDIEIEVIEAALEKASGENKVRTAIINGMSTVDAFRKFGIM